MSVIAQIDEAARNQDSAAVVETLIAGLRETHDYDRLFDALLLKEKRNRGLPLARPAGWEDVPESEKKVFEEAYLKAAREVGQLHIDAGDLPRAWVYFRTIREHEPMTKALAEIDPASLDYEQADELIGIALHDGANRVAGVKMLLVCHGTCNTITIVSQLLHTLTPEERRQVAAMLVRDVYKSLLAALQLEVGRKEPDQATNPSVRSLITGRDALFANAGYHVDTSHLHAVVRFAQALHPDDPEFPLARELAEYGRGLDPQFQYASDLPFDDFYTAQQAYLAAVAGEEEGFDYFRKRLEQEPDEPDQQMIAYVLCDLLMRRERNAEAVELAARHLPNLEEASGFSFAKLCTQAGFFDVLKQSAREADDPVRYAIAILSGSK